jgi:hypothetical protein
VPEGVHRGVAHGYALGVEVNRVHDLVLAFALAYLLVCRVGKFELRQTKDVLVLGLGILLMSVMAARSFGRFY